MTEAQSGVFPGTLGQGSDSSGRVRYRTICVDPPWHYDSWPGQMSKGMSGSSRARMVVDPNWPRKPLDYESMSVDEIAALPVQSLAEPSGCHLYLWTTNRYLPVAFEILQAWGFRYSQTLVWAKTPMGQGPGGTFAQNAEYVLFARKGTLKALRRLDSVWFNWPRTTVHSRKPEHFIDMVESVSPGPYVELFSRRHRMGWATWGNESANTAEMPA